MSTGEAAAGPDDVSVVVLAGGTSRRFGSDKLAAPLGGSTVLDTVLASLPAGWDVVAVGPARKTRRPVTWTREDPPGGGPLAGVAAGIALVRTTLVAVVAGDMPYAGPAVPALVAALRAASTDVVGVVARDEEGVSNPLLAAYRTDALREGLPTPSEGRPAKLLLALPHLELTVTGSAARDVDTPADLDELGGHR
jgi:molybdopterin-guanine dinucleotide biosynthesis protein A